MSNDPDVDASDKQTPNGGEGLRAAEHDLLALRIGEQFREPRDRGNELDENTDESGAAKKEERTKAGAQARGDRRKGVKENARGHDAFAAKAVNEPAAKQAEDATGESGEPKQTARP